ncbi:peptide chain release factor N(5)-glutamine methyltransferase [Patescibacteria group bacterium]
MTIKDTLARAVNLLIKNKISSPHLDAEILLAKVISRDRSFLTAHSEYVMSARQINNYHQAIHRRTGGEPVAYITGHKEFYGLDFLVNKHVLIPRPDTELLVEKAIEIITRNKLKTIADIGTGAGNIAITLKKNIPELKIYATDISKRALKVALANAKKHQAAIRFIHGNLLNPVKNIKLDLIIANLPYLDPEWFTDKSIKYEPAIALGAGELGFDLYRRFFNQLRRYHITATTFIEIDPRQRKAIESFLNKCDIDYSDSHNKKDRFMEINRCPDLY